VNKQLKPFWLGWKRGSRNYGIRDNLAITIAHNRPWYRGYYYVDGWNTEFPGDAEGRYYYRSVKATRVRLKTRRPSYGVHPA
jgi:hypothetical protein